MSEHITHTAICDDVRRVITCFQDLPTIFSAAWTRHAEEAQLGGVTRGADRWSIDTIQWVRAQIDRPDGQRDSDTEKVLAFVLGALTHRSIDRQMKPVFRSFEQAIDARTDPSAAVNECTIYCDLLILREVFGVGGHFEPRLFDGAVHGPPATFHNLLRTTWQRVLIQMHTLKPDHGHPIDWMRRLFRGVQEFTVDLRHYDRVAAAPDPLKWQRYLIDTRFYERSDPLIAAARIIQRGERAPNQSYDRLINGNTSLYGRAMKRSVEYVYTAARLFEGTLDQRQAEAGLDIGVPDVA